MLKNQWVKLFLSILVLLSFVWLWNTRFDELAYHTWQHHDLLELGEATSVDFTKIPDNTFVHITGVLGTKAATIRGMREGSFRYGPFQIRPIVGSKVYLEFDQDKYLNQFVPFSRIDIKGRLASFGPGSDLQKVRDFFAKQYGKVVDGDARIIIVDEEPRTQWRYLFLFICSLLVVAFSFFVSLQTFWANHKRKTSGET